MTASLISELGTVAPKVEDAPKPPIIGMALIAKMCHVILLTGKIKGHSPLSLLLIAAPEHGKTSVVLQRACPAVVDVTDATGRGIVEILKTKPNISHLIFNDFVAINSHSKTVRAYTIAMINAMTEEGIRTIAFPGSVESFSEVQGKKGIIACLTMDLMKDGRSWFNKIGLTSRMIPFSFSHSPELQLAIKDAIDTDYKNIKLNDRGKMSIPSIAISVTISTAFTNEIRKIADQKAKDLKDPTGYRRLKQFRSLAKAHAVSRTWKNPSVNKSDIDFLHRILPYISYDKCENLPDQKRERT